VKILWVDDIRNPPSGIVCDIARNYVQAMEFLTTNTYDAAYLDHDLSSFDAAGHEKTGYDVLMQIVQMRMDGRPVPREFHLLTANPVGAERMQGVIERYLSEH
jgi:CheY-like chemotaxis protein